MQTNKISALILGLCISLGLTALGYLLANSVNEYKKYERSVTVKGLAEKDYNADVVIWPIHFTSANNEIESLYNSIEENTKKITQFLNKNGVLENEITLNSPSITDKSAQQYGGDTSKAEFRYTANQTVTVYSKNVDSIRSIMGKLAQLGKNGIAFTSESYLPQTEYIFTKLNEIKPQMIEEATKNAREVAQKFASDSNSTLGKIKSASQGQFSINDRDKNNPHIKQVRVVSTVEYYLSD